MADKLSDTIVDVMSNPEDEDTDMDTDSDSYEESDPECYCGHLAKLKVSRISKNPNRLFYNCPKRMSRQCEFFCWSDESLSSTEDGYVGEQNLIRNECLVLRERLDEMQQDHDTEKDAWEREKSELTSELSSVRTELEDVKNSIKMVNESDLMPPFNKSSVQDDDEMKEPDE